MIWFYLAGFISGAVGMMLYANWWMKKHATIIKIQEEEMEEEHDERD